MKFPIRVLSLFSGIGGYEKALANIGIPHRVTNYCEIDAVASRCYSLLHNVPERRNLRDVRKIDPTLLNDFDLLTFSPPCQDISAIGRHAGITKQSRTGLMWHVVPIIEAKLPSVIVMENVMALATKYRSILDDYVLELTKRGYQCSTAILNAKHHGVPQNRRRLFLVGTLSGGFKWPMPRPLTSKLQDYLDRKGDCEKEVAYTIRIGGRRSKVGDRHNWDCYLVDGKPHHLSARECLRLMGFGPSDYETLVANGITQTAIYRAAGNCVVVGVLESLFRSMFGGQLNSAAS